MIIVPKSGFPLYEHTPEVERFTLRRSVTWITACADVDNSTSTLAAGRSLMPIFAEVLPVTSALLALPESCTTPEVDASTKMVSATYTVPRICPDVLAIIERFADPKQRVAYRRIFLNAGGKIPESEV